MIDNNLAALVAEYSRLSTLDTLVDDEEAQDALQAILELAIYDSELDRWLNFVDEIIDKLF